jgi:hypothetical protein
MKTKVTERMLENMPEDIKDKIDNYAKLAVNNIRVLNVDDIISKGLYSIATIRRKSDMKIFRCYFRNANVLFNEPCKRSWFIDDGEEELNLITIDTNIYDVLEIVFDDSN